MLPLLVDSYHRRPPHDLSNYSCGDRRRARPGHVAAAADWITAPSYYSHDPDTGQRVTQYSPIGPFYTFARPDFQRSGYRHTRSSYSGRAVGGQLSRGGRVGTSRASLRRMAIPLSTLQRSVRGLGSTVCRFESAGLLSVPTGGRALQHALGAAPSGQAMPYDQQQPPPYYDGSYPQYRAAASRSLGSAAAVTCSTRRTKTRRRSGQR